MPVMAALIRQYENDRAARFVNFTPLDSDQIVGFLSRGHCDVGMTLDSRLTDADKKRAASLQNAVLGRFVVGIAANATTPLRTIAVDDLGKIFAGEATFWKDVPGSGLSTPIEILGRTAISTEGMILDDTVLRGRQFASAFYDQPASEPAQKARDEQVVTALIKRPSAIGFLRYPPGGKLDKRVRVLGIVTTKRGKAVFPTTATVADGSYPLTDSLTLYLQPAAPQSAREFCKFAAGPEGAKIVKQCGLWPEYELNDLRGVKRLADVKAHRGVEVAVSGSPAWQGMMKELGTEFSRAKMAVEIKYRAGTQYEGVGEFVGAEEKSEIRNPKSETNREENQNPKSGTEGQGSQLLLIDSMLETKTAHQYDAAWKVIKPTKLTLGWRAAAIVVHPTNPVSTISYRASPRRLRRTEQGLVRRGAGGEARAGSRERGAGSKDGGAGSKGASIGAVFRRDPPVWAAGRRPHQPAHGNGARLETTRQGPAQGRYRQADPDRGPRSAGYGHRGPLADAGRGGVGEDIGDCAVPPGRRDLRDAAEGLLAEPAGQPVGLGGGRAAGEGLCRVPGLGRVRGDAPAAWPGAEGPGGQEGGAGGRREEREVGGRVSRLCNAVANQATAFPKNGRLPHPRLPSHLENGDPATRGTRARRRSRADGHRPILRSKLIMLQVFNLFV